MISICPANMPVACPFMKVVAATLRMCLQGATINLIGTVDHRPVLCTLLDGNFSTCSSEHHDSPSCTAVHVCVSYVVSDYSAYGPAGLCSDVHCRLVDDDGQCSALWHSTMAVVRLCLYEQRSWCFLPSWQAHSVCSTQYRLPGIGVRLSWMATDVLL